MARYLVNILISIDQVGTTIVGGFPDETLSSYAWRMEKQGKPWGATRRMIDGLFIWSGPNHCENSYLAEVTRRQMPPELR